jgi:hypothetical protein
MKAEEFKEIMIDYLSGNIADDKRQEFEKCLAENLTFQKEFEATKAFWNTDEEVPGPTTAMDMKFYSMLSVEEKKANKVSFIKKIENFFIGSFPKQLAYTLAILTVGFFIGNGFDSKDNQSEQNLKVAQEETESVRSQLVLTLLDQPSANQRLQAVSEVNKLSSVTEQILKGLFSMLNNDDNVNVRLSALEALKKYTDIPLVRTGLINSLMKQKSPLVQIALADIMVVLQEKKAVKSLKKLIKEEDVNSSAKQRMEESIQRII